MVLLCGRLRYRSSRHISTTCELRNCVHGSRSSGVSAIDDKAHGITACARQREVLRLLKCLF